MKITKECKKISLPSSLNNEISERALLYKLLYHDFQNCLERLNQGGNTDFWRRLCFRCFFSLIEAMNYKMRCLLLASSKEGVISLEPEEILLLQEQVPDLKNSGEVKLTKRFLDFKAYFKFTLSIYAKYLTPGLSINFEDNGWNELLEAQETRNMLTHPRSFQQCIVTDEEMKSLQEGSNWYFKVIAELLQNETVQFN